MEVEWVRLDAARLRMVMSVETSSYYMSWTDKRPDREARLVEIVRGVVSEFRAALMANPLNSLNPDTNMLPLPCVRYAETLAIGALHREMDRPMSEAEQSRQIRAEIMLRTFYARGFLVAPESGSAGGVGRASYRPGRRGDCGRGGYGPLVGGGAAGTAVPAPVAPPAIEYAYFGQADGVIVGAAFAVWANAAAVAGRRIEGPVEGGSEFTLSVVPPAANLVIAYPASIRELHSAVQQSTGIESRLGWINGPHSAVVDVGGVAYRVYQWVPAFAWENADSFRVGL